MKDGRDNEVKHDAELKLKRTAQSTKMEANVDNVCGTLSRASAWVEAGRAGFVRAQRRECRMPIVSRYFIATQSFLSCICGVESSPVDVEDVSMTQMESVHLIHMNARLVQFFRL